MAKRRIVPDASVILPAFFKEELDWQGSAFPISRRAADLVDAIRDRSVEAFAPELLRVEFLKGAVRKRSEHPRQIDASLVQSKFREFMQLPITFADVQHFGEDAAKLCLE